MRNRLRSLKGLSVGSDKVIQSETSIDSKLCGCTRNFLHGVEEVARSNRVAPTRFCSQDRGFCGLPIQPFYSALGRKSFGAKQHPPMGNERSESGRIVSPRPVLRPKPYPYPIPMFRPNGDIRCGPFLLSLSRTSSDRRNWPPTSCSPCFRPYSAGFWHEFDAQGAGIRKDSSESDAVWIVF